MHLPGDKSIVYASENPADDFGAEPPGEQEPRLSAAFFRIRRGLPELASPDLERAFELAGACFPRGQCRLCVRNPLGPQIALDPGSAELSRHDMSARLGKSGIGERFVLHQVFEKRVELLGRFGMGKQLAP